MFVEHGVQRGKRYSLFIGSWSFAAMWLNQTVDIRSPFVRKEKEVQCTPLWKLQASHGITLDRVISCFPSQSVTLLVSFGTSLRITCEDISLWTTTLMGPHAKLLECFVLAVQYFLPHKGICSPLFWGSTPPSLVCIPTALASRIGCCHLCVLKIYQSCTVRGPQPVCCQLALSVALISR